MCQSEMKKETWFEMLMEQRVARFYSKWLTSTKQFWNGTNNTFTKQMTLHLKEEQRTLFCMISLGKLG
jgi:hypothetical protein